jgi:hypothetical protein
MITSIYEIMHMPIFGKTACLFYITTQRHTINNENTLFFLPKKLQIAWLLVYELCSTIESLDSPKKNQEPRQALEMKAIPWWND